MHHLPIRAAALALTITSVAAQGTLLGDHWSFQAVSTASSTAGSVTELASILDAFVEERRHSMGLRGSQPADRRTLVHRLYLDVHGLPPSLECTEEFVADDRPGAYARLVDRVLQSPRYGERWAQHWLDVVRYADTHGFEVNTPRTNAWPYRDWVIRALNADLPYDRFVIAQIAGNGRDAREQDVAATGFLVAGPALLAGQVGKDEPSIRQARQDQLDEIIKAVGTSFLGLTIGCARCHDHKFDPIRQRDYYAMQAVFAGVRYMDRPLPNAAKVRQADAILPQLETLRRSLAAYVKTTFAGRSMLIDDESGPPTRERNFGVTLLRKPVGHGQNPKGESRGHLDDPGGEHSANLSRGRYTCWRGMANEDLLAYHPGEAGRFRIWLSWGSGWATHTREAQYFLDADGDLSTREDRSLLARVDQQRFADGSGEVSRKSLWSGLLDVGVHEVGVCSTIILCAGEGATTADVVVLQEVQPGEQVHSSPRLRGVVDARRNLERFAPIRARFVRFTSFSTNSGVEPCIDELEVFPIASGDDAPPNIALASAGGIATSSGNYPNSGLHKLEHINDGRYGNERSWISNEYGRGWVQIEFSDTHVIDTIVWGRDRNRRYSDRLAVRYKIEVAETVGDWHVVTSSADRVPLAGQKATDRTYDFTGLSAAETASAEALLVEFKRLEQKLAGLRKREQVFAGSFTEPDVTHCLFRGDPMMPRELIAPATPGMFGVSQVPVDGGDHQRRLAVAQWLASPKNPLTARVIANRIWQHHFGVGIVATPSDFGHSGRSPSHPALLDWLASVLVAHDWSLKQMHRIILLSQTYRQANAPRSDAMAVDADNRLLWRFMPRRLEAEAIRDRMLAVSGALDLRMGGVGFSLFVPNTNYVRVYEPRTEWTPDTWRRMIYAHKVRMEQGGVFGAFDCPDAGQTAPRRGRSTTALQALNLWNSSFVMQQAGLMAGRIEQSSKGSVARVERAFELALGRLPRPSEAGPSQLLVDRDGLESLCRVLLNTNEFLVIP